MKQQTQSIQTLNELIQKRNLIMSVSTKTKIIVKATIEVEGRRYTGKGETAIEAKNAAAENAIKDIFNY